MIVQITAIFCQTSEDLSIFSETFPGLVLGGAGSSFLCSCKLFYNLIGPFYVVLCQVGIDFFTLLFDPVFLCLFDGFPYFVVYFSVLAYSLCVMFLVL